MNLTAIVYAALLIIAVGLLVERVIKFLLSFVPETTCTGDCNQGRNCNCDK